MTISLIWHLARDKLNRLFDLETDFTFESSEQAWAALLWALEIENAQSFLKSWKTSRQFAKQVQDLLIILALRENGELSKRDCYRFDIDLLYRLKIFVKLKEKKSTHKPSQKNTKA